MGEWKETKRQHALREIAGEIEEEASANLYDAPVHPPSLLPSWWVGWSTTWYGADVFFFVQTTPGNVSRSRITAGKSPCLSWPNNRGESSGGTYHVELRKKGGDGGIEPCNVLARSRKR